MQRDAYVSYNGVFFFLVVHTDVNSRLARTVWTSMSTSTRWRVTRLSPDVTPDLDDDGSTQRKRWSERTDCRMTARQ